MADEGYLRWAELCVRAIERHHPQSTIHLYDLSESPGSRLRAAFENKPNVRLTHVPPSAWRWPAWIDHADFDFIWPRFGLRESLKYYSRKLRKALGRHNENWMTDKQAHVKRVRYFLRLVSQKPAFIARTLNASASDVVFIDADAILLRSLESVFNFDFDFAVTTEEPGDVVVGPDPAKCIERPHYPFKALNVGVMFARNNRATRKLMDAWIAEMETVRHILVEQTALANLIYRHDASFFEQYFRTTNIPLQGEWTAALLSLPMAQYNYTHVRPGGEQLAKEKYVLHFVGSRKQAEHWEWVQKLILSQA